MDWRNKSKYRETKKKAIIIEPSRRCGGSMVVPDMVLTWMQAMNKRQDLMKTPMVDSWERLKEWKSWNQEFSF